MQSAKVSTSPHMENALTTTKISKLGGGAFFPLLLRPAPSRCSSREHPPYGPDQKWFGPILIRGGGSVAIMQMKRAAQMDGPSTTRLDRWSGDFGFGTED